MAEEKQAVTRRNFGKTLTGVGAVAAVAGPVAAQIAAPGPGQFGPVVVGNYAMVDQLVFGGIGIRGRGMSDLRMLLGDSRVRFVGIADVRESARETVKSTVDGYYKNNDCKMYRDPAEILARTDIDALLIATSDRWHGPMAMWAAQSGKDMYIEKPGASRGFTRTSRPSCMPACCAKLALIMARGASTPITIPTTIWFARVAGPLPTWTSIRWVRGNCAANFK